MRAGETVGRMTTAEATPASIARMMVGRDVQLALEHDGGVRTPPRATSLPGLTVERLVVASSRRPDEVDGVSFEVHQGEIFGIAGVEGNGQTELIEAVAGLRPVGAGHIKLGTADVTHWPVRRRADAGLSHIPEDRHRRGLVLDYPIADDLILGLQHRFSRGMALVRDRIRHNAAERIAQFDVRPPQPHTAARALSGGNQQKVVIARELRGREFTVLLAVQPTRGVDVGAIEFIHEQLRAARDAGKAVLLVSADLVEVLALSDRVGVMYGGRLVVTLPRANASAAVLGPWMTGAAHADATNG
jgi:simple sugar transport system ATP-binding protein